MRLSLKSYIDYKYKPIKLLGALFCVLQNTLCGFGHTQGFEGSAIHVGTGVCDVLAVKYLLGIVKFAIWSNPGLKEKFLTS